MNRRSSTILVLGLLLIGVAVCLKQTLDSYDVFEANVASTLLATEAVLVTIILGSIVLLVRRKFSKHPKLNRPKRLEAFGQLRRLFASVWS
jgi:hypothetical protein